jgi:hypothetical protein
VPTARRRPRLSVLVAVTSLVLVGTAGTAYGQDDPSTPPPSDTPTSATDTPTESSAPTSGEPTEEQGAPQQPAVPDPPSEEEPEPGNPVPPPDNFVSAVATCNDGTAAVDVHVFDVPSASFTVSLYQQLPGGGFNEFKNTTYEPASQTHMATFEPVPIGLYVAYVSGTGKFTDVTTEVKDCADLEPGDGALTVQVECKAGWGIATFQVANQETGDVRTYTLTINDVPAYDIELSPGLFLRITENRYDDGEYIAELTGDGIRVTEHFAVACASGQAPKVFADSFCDALDPSQPADNFVGITNENRTDVGYTVVVREQGKPEVTKKVTIGGGQTGAAEFTGIGVGDHPVQVKGSDESIAAAVLIVDDCADVKLDPDGLQVSVRCADGESVVTFRFFPRGEFPETHQFSVDGSDKYNREVFFGGEGPYLFNRYVGEFADGAYTARLVGDGLNTVEQFTVDCDGVPNTPPATPAPTPQGRSASGLASTGATVGGLVMLGLLALGLGGALVLSGRRRRVAKGGG